ncbi:MAG TPA: DedA family protein [Candidatus Avimuribaculum pullicola]|nr:DedA family protein [Candidatus Avimuribaculum pullicola]
MDTLAIYEWFMENMNYGWITLLMAIESSFIPFPSEIVVPPAAFKAMQPDSGLNIYLVVVFATIGAMIGAIFNYYVAMWIGRPLVYKFADSRLGHICLLNGEKVQQAELYFDRHGAISTFIGRLLPAIRQLISIPAGLARMHFGKFLAYTTLGAGLWNIVLALLGYWLSTFVVESELRAQIEHYNSYLNYVGYAVIAVIVVFILYHAFKKKPANSEK